MTESPRRNSFGSTIFGASAPNRGATGGSNDLLGDLVAKAQRGARGETGALELLERETEMRNLSKKAKTIIAGAAIAGLASAGGAYAYWTTSGSGSGTASTTTPTANLQVTQTSAPTNMAPGIAAGGVSVDVQNLATNNAHVSQVVASIFSVTGGAGACTSADYDLSAATMTNGAADLAQNATASFSGATLGFHNSGSNQDGCQGATVTLHYVVS